MPLLSSSWLRARAWPFFLSYHLLFGLGLAIVLGVAAPSPGKAVGKAPLSVANLMVVLIFLLAGVKLKTSELKNAVKFPKPLAVGLCMILLVTPLTAFPILAALKGVMEFEEFSLGLALFAAMPTTISSAVVLVTLVKGNVGLSLVLSVVTNIAATMTVPVVLTLLVGAGGDSIDTLDLLGKLLLTILLPVVVGKAASYVPAVAAVAKRFDTSLKLLSSLFLIVIPWIKISQADKEISRVSPGSIFALLALGIALHCVLLLLNFAVCTLLRMGLNDLKSVVITSSQKSLGTGVAIVAFLPSELGIQGAIVLPFILAHFSQIVMDGLMVPWWLRLKRDEAAPATEPAVSIICIPVPSAVPDSDSDALRTDTSSTQMLPAVVSVVIDQTPIVPPANA